MTQRYSAETRRPAADSLTLTSQEQVAPALSVQSAESEAGEDHRGPHEGRDDDAEETATVTRGSALLPPAATAAATYLGLTAMTKSRVGPRPRPERGRQEESRGARRPPSPR